MKVSYCIRHDATLLGGKYIHRSDWIIVTRRSFAGIKLQPAIFHLSQHVIRFHELQADTTQRFLQYGSSYYANILYNANTDFMSQILYINILVDWSLSGIMTSKHVIRESESPRPAASSILISRMTRSSVIIPYRGCDACSCVGQAGVKWPS